MELNTGPETGINYGLHGLPERLQEDYPPGVCVTLGDQNQYGPHILTRDIPGTPHVLGYFHNICPPSRLRGWGGIPIPDRPHGAKSRIAPHGGGCDRLPCRGEVSDLCLQLHLCWDLITNMEGVNVSGRWITRGIMILLLVEGGAFLCGLSHVGPGRVGRSGGRMLVPLFEDCICPA